jgi:hypothetical protein
LRWLLLVSVLAIGPGCTSVALKRATLAQAESSTDLRYKEVIENLAMSAAEPDILPSYSSIYAGSTDVNDVIRATSASVWVRAALKHPGWFATFFSTQTADFVGSRAVKSNWTLDPTIVPEKLRAMRAASRWVTLGREEVGPDLRYLFAYKPPTYQTWFELLPLPSEKDLSRIPISGRNLVIVAEVNRMLYFRIFNGSGVQKIDGYAKDIIKNTELSKQINNLSYIDSELKRLKPGANLSPEVEANVLAAVTTVLQHPVPSDFAPVMTDPGTGEGNFFDVIDDLAALPPGWLHRETRWKDVPWNACYSAGSGDTFVWVGPEGMEGLSKFLLILQKIARTDFGSAYYPKTLTRKVEKDFAFKEQGKNYVATATFYLDEQGLLTSGQNAPALPRKVRVDNVGTASELKSVISATAKSPQ